MARLSALLVATLAPWGCATSPVTPTPPAPVPVADLAASALPEPAQGIPNDGETASVVPPWVLTIDGEDHGFQSALADEQLGLRLELTLAPTSGQGAPWQLTMYLPRGPDGRHFSGRAFGTTALFSRDFGTVTRLAEHQTLLSLEPFELRDGAIIGGSLEVDAVVLSVHGKLLRFAGGGAFEATYRGGDRSPNDYEAPPPAAALLLPLAGSLFRQSFRPRSSMANLVRDPSGRAVLSDLVFFEAPANGCDPPAGRAIEVTLQSPTGEEARRGPQPTGQVTVKRYRGGQLIEAETTWYPDGWFELDPTPLEARGRATGTLVVFRGLQYTGNELDPYVAVVRLMGAFDALVCHRGTAAEWEARRDASPP